MILHSITVITHLEDVSKASFSGSLDTLCNIVSRDWSKVTTNSIHSFLKKVLEKGA